MDTFADPTLPSLFIPMPIAAVAWNDPAPGLDTTPGIFGWDTSWDYLAYAAGDADGDVNDFADTWGISSEGALGLVPICPASPAIEVPAGEPFPVNSDGQDCF